MDPDNISLLRNAPTLIQNENVDLTRLSDPPVPPRKFGQYVAALSATISALSAGVVLGWTSPILTDMKHGNFHNITVDENQMGWIGSFVTLGAMVTCIPIGFICDLIGRKKTLLLLTIPFVIGWALILFATSIIMLYFGRLILGMAVGACCVAAPLYCNEISSRDVQGALGSYFQLMVTVGVFLAYSFGSFLSVIPYSFVCATFPIFFAVLFSFQPESPVYCLKNGRPDQALKALLFLRGPEYDCQSELAEIEGRIKENGQIRLSPLGSFKKRSNRKAMLIALSLMFFQQFSGINAVILYVSDIFKSSGLKLDVNLASVIIGGVQALATFFSSLVVDKLGRRILLLISAGMMSLSVLFLSLYFTLKFDHLVDNDVLLKLSFIPIISLCVFVIVFSLGFGPIPWMISSEIFPSDIKSVAASTAGTFNWFLAFLVTKFYLQVSNSIGEDSTFYLFSSISAMGMIFVYFVVPETKGKSIEEIQEELEN